MHPDRQLLTVWITLVVTTPLAAQGPRTAVYGGWTELTSGPGLMARIQPTEFPLAAVAQIGPRGTGAGLDVSWVRPADRGGVIEPRVFLSAGLGFRFHSDTTYVTNATHVGWGDLLVVGGIRVPYPGGGPVCDLGLGVIRSLGGANESGYTAGLAGRFVLGWAF